MWYQKQIGLYAMIQIWIRWNNVFIKITAGNGTVNVLCKFNFKSTEKWVQWMFFIALILKSQLLNILCKF